jgi:hypothetical protein
LYLAYKEKKIYYERYVQKNGLNFCSRAYPFATTQAIKRGMKPSFIDNDASAPLQSQSVFHRYQIIHANALALKGFALISPQMQRSVSL